MFHFPLLLYAEWHHDIQKETRPFDTNLVPHRRSASTQRRWQGAKAVCDRPTWSLCQSRRETGLINSWISVFSSGGGECCSACSCMTSASGKPSLAAEYIHAAWGHRGGWMRGIRNRLIYAWKCYLLSVFSCPHFLSRLCQLLSIFRSKYIHESIIGNNFLCYLWLNCVLYFFTPNGCYSSISDAE